MAIVQLSGTSVALGAAALIGLWIVYELAFSPLRHFSGPTLARFTNFYRSGLTLQGKVDSNFKHWHRQWGTAVRVGTNCISISDPDLIKVIYTTKNAWVKSEMYRVNDVVVNGQRMPNIFNTPDKAFHAKYSNPIRGFWSMTKILDMEPLMDETLRELVAVLTTRFADPEKERDNPVCMMDDWLTYYAWDATANVSFGKQYGFLQQGRDVEGIIGESTAGLKYFAPVSQMPWIDEWLDKNPVLRIGPRPLVNGFVYTVRMITEYHQDMAAGNKTKPVDTFLDKYYTLKGNPDFVDDSQIINWIMLNVLAGGDSTSGAMRSFVYHISRTPSAERALLAELDAANLSLPVQWRDIKDLPYLNAAALESHRITPALGLMLEREVPAGGFQLPDGRFIPAGTKVGMNPCVVTRDVDVFGEDVETFRPERWLRGRDEGEDEFAHRYRRMAEATDLMYGAGSRVCMGKHMAKVLMYKLFATLYTAFDIKLTSPDHEWKYFNAWFMYQTDMPMIITRRQKA